MMGEEDQTGAGAQRIRVGRRRLGGRCGGRGRSAAVSSELAGERLGDAVGTLGERFCHETEHGVGDAWWQSYDGPSGRRFDNNVPRHRFVSSSSRSASRLTPVPRTSDSCASTISARWSTSASHSIVRLMDSTSSGVRITAAGLPCRVMVTGSLVRWSSSRTPDRWALTSASGKDLHARQALVVIPARRNAHLAVNDLVDKPVLVADPT